MDIKTINVGKKKLYVSPSICIYPIGSNLTEGDGLPVDSDSGVEFPLVIEEDKGCALGSGECTAPR